MLIVAMARILSWLRVRCSRPHLARGSLQRSAVGERRLQLDDAQSLSWILRGQAGGITGSRCSEIERIA